MGRIKKVLSKDGTAIAYETIGEGAPLVLVHGTGGTRERWAPVVPALASHFTVYAMDRRGRGESQDGTAVYTIEREFEDVAALVDSIGTPVNLFGHSYGGICALEASVHQQSGPSPRSLRAAGTPCWFSGLSSGHHREASGSPRCRRPGGCSGDVHDRIGEDVGEGAEIDHLDACMAFPSGRCRYPSQRTEGSRAVPVCARPVQGDDHPHAPFDRRG